MPAKRLEFLKGPLNTSNDTTAGGMVEPITGLPLYGGLAPGDYFDMTREEALRYSNTTVGTLLEGRYMRVQLDVGAVVAGNGILVLGQGLFWKLGNAANKYLVTNVNPGGAVSAPVAGIFLNTGPAGAFPVTPGNWFFMQVISPGRATVKMAATLTSGALAAWDAINCKIGAAAVDAALFDDSNSVDLTTTIVAAAAATIGFAETAPVASGLVVVDINKAGPAVI